MEDKSLLFESNFADETSPANNDHGWQKVTYAKKQRKNHNQAKAADPDRVIPNGSELSGRDSVFKSLEKHAEERRLRIAAETAAMYELDEAPVRSRQRRSYDDNDGEVSESEGFEKTTLDEKDKKKKEKPKKEKKPKVTVSEAAAKIDAGDLAAFLADVSVSYELQQEIQLMRFVDYFGRAFSAVSASQFPWLKLFRESAVAKIADVPISHISEAVYKTSVDWINQHSYEALGSFVLWLMDSVLVDLAIQQGGSKGSKKGGQQMSSRSQVAIFVVLSMVLRRKPDVLINLLPSLRENAKYQGQDKLQVIVWMIVQASQGDLCVGLFLWAHMILPILGGKSGSNPQSRDLVLQLVERILSAPKARTILVNGAVRKGERLVPPSALDLLLRVSFPASSARVKATERFEAIYPILKDVALAGSAGSKAMKQISQQILFVAAKAAGEGTPELSQEAIHIFIWCLTQSSDCYKQWDMIYTDNVEGSVAVLRKLTVEWKELSAKKTNLEVLKETIRSFRQKNEKALHDGSDAGHQSLYKDADKYCKVLLGRISRGHACMKTIALGIVVLGVGFAIASPNIEALDWNRFSVLFNAHRSF